MGRRFVCFDISELTSASIYKEIGSGVRVALSKLAVQKFEETGRPLRLAIDTPIWLFQIQASKGTPLTSDCRSLGMMADSFKAGRIPPSELFTIACFDSCRSQCTRYLCLTVLKDQNSNGTSEWAVAELRSAQSRSIWLNSS